MQSTEIALPICSNPTAVDSSNVEEGVDHEDEVDDPNCSDKKACTRQAF